MGAWHFEWDPAKAESNRRKHGISFEKADMTDDIPELTKRQFSRALPRRLRERLIRGEIRGGADIAALRRFVGLSQPRFAAALGISVHTLRNWEQGRRAPEGPALALLRVAARHPRVLFENLGSARS